MCSEYIKYNVYMVYMEDKEKINESPMIAKKSLNWVIRPILADTTTTTSLESKTCNIGENKDQTTENANTDKNNWFDDPYDIVSQNAIKNGKPMGDSSKNYDIKDLYRPIGVNTITTCLGPKNIDIKGKIPEPTTKISPWLNTTIEPDTDTKNQKLCY
jgi:hypothetical protein